MDPEFKAPPTAKAWDAIYRADGREMYLVRNPRRFQRLTKRLPLRSLLRQGLIRQGDAVLEVGCGGGQYGLALATRGCQVVLLDYSRATLEVTRSNAHTARQINPTLSARLVQGDFFGLGFAAHSFDVVFNEGSLEHFATSAERGRCLREMVRVTKPNGRVMLMLPNNLHPWVPYWKKHNFSWLQESSVLREYAISAPMLQEEMTEAGLRSVYVDGYEVYDTIQKWPQTRPRTFLARVLKTILPEPSRRLRIKYGTYLFAIGTV